MPQRVLRKLTRKRSGMPVAQSKLQTAEQVQFPHTASANALYMTGAENWQVTHQVNE